MREKNKFIINNNDTVSIIIESSVVETKIAIVDLDMLDSVSKFRWWIQKDKRWTDNNIVYVRSKLNNLPMMLHWLIVGKPIKPYTVDHINRDPLDNRRLNLRVITHQQNTFNTKSDGVRFDTRNGKMVIANTF